MNTNPTNNRASIKVLWKDKQFLLYTIGVIFFLQIRWQVMNNDMTGLSSLGCNEINVMSLFVTYNTRQSVLRRKRIYASFVKSKIPKIFEVVYR
jgi:hypothetical protein